MIPTTTQLTVDEFAMSATALCELDDVWYVRSPREVVRSPVVINGIVARRILGVDSNDDNDDDINSGRENTRDRDRNDFGGVVLHVEVVYDAAWRVPVLILSTADASGMPVVPPWRAPSDSVPLLRVSQTDHPIRGTPAWVAHPCDTEQAVAMLLDSHDKPHSSRWISRYVAAFISLMQSWLVLPSESLITCSVFVQDTCCGTQNVIQDDIVIEQQPSTLSIP